MNQYKILVINPGSTSTKLALFKGDQPVIMQEIRHEAHELEKFETVYAQRDFRTQFVRRFIDEKKIDLLSLDAIACRGGNMKPVAGGTYATSEEMLRDLETGVMGQHASNLGGLIGSSIAGTSGIPVFITDPVVVDELDDLARISGCPDIQRKSKDHPLNQKAAARKAATRLGHAYESLDMIVVHMGGGMSVGIHRQGRIVDVNNSLDGDGPFSPERAGGLPCGSLIDICYSGEYSKQELRKKLVGNGGLTAYLGTSDARRITHRISEGDERAKLIYEAMAYQIAKEIGAGATVLNGKVDAIVLTGGLAHDSLLTGWIRERVSFIGPIFVFAGEFEMEALASGARCVLEDKELLKQYD